MTTEYYQIPSQQGLLPLDSVAVPDPWLASATNTLSSLSLYDNTWGVKSKLVAPSLFDQGEEDAAAWNHLVSMHTAGTSSSKTMEVKAPIVPKQFHSTTSKIDAWSVVDNVVNSPKSHKRSSSNNSSASAVPETTADGKPVEEELTGYKTELCKSFTETGACRYGTKCQFAHGKEEIRPILRHPKYKTEICKTFHTTGTCPYGIRCRFIHTRSKEESMMAMKVPTVPVLEEEEDADDDGVISLSHPPGIPVPQWSKSWNVAIGSPAVSRKARGTA